jgi:hypothetical protein
MDSSHDNRIAAAEAIARETLDPATAQIGDSISYDEMEDIDDAGYGYLRRRLAERGLYLQDTGSDYEVIEDPRR